MTAMHKKGPWSTAEDAQLMHLIRITGPAQWVKISEQMGSRSAKQCRERYHQNLKPGLRRDPISAEEGRIIEQLVKQMGRRWADIARKLHNRSDNHVKNWWNGSSMQKKGLKARKASPRTRQSSVESLHYRQAPEYFRTTHDYAAYSHHHAAPPPSTSFSNAHHPQFPGVTHSSLPSPSTISAGGEPLDRAPSLMSDSGSLHSMSPKSVAMPGTPDSPPILPPLKIDDGDYHGPKLPIMNCRPAPVQLPSIRDTMLPGPCSPTDIRPGLLGAPGDRRETPAAGMPTQMKLPPISELRHPAPTMPNSFYGYPSRTDHSTRSPL
ncbi:hypothetical protein DL770_006991 [Monosporascus sp. CRB-9-2]|nr:hypothetical protein DL770_006991 [Monosporascus sp. CRB-9-2]